MEKQLMIRNLVSMVEKTPKKIFILDGFGAIFTAFSLGVVLVNLEGVFGIPKKTLQILSSIPLAYLVYDIFCYYNVNDQIGFWLKGIAILNLLYCPVSIVFALNDREYITLLGWIYIVIEIIAIVIIAAYEWRFANKLMKKEVD